MTSNDALEMLLVLFIAGLAVGLFFSIVAKH